jgi:hypothetical protein
MLRNRLEPRLVGVVLFTTSIVVLVSISSGPSLYRVELSRPWMVDAANLAALDPYRGYRQILRLDPVPTSAKSIPDEEKPLYSSEPDLFPSHAEDSNSEESIIKYLQSRARSQVSKKTANQHGWNWGDFNRFGDDEVSSVFLTLSFTFGNDFGNANTAAESEFPERRIIWRQESLRC